MKYVVKFGRTNKAYTSIGPGRVADVVAGIRVVIIDWAEF